MDLITKMIIALFVVTCFGYGDHAYEAKLARDMLSKLERMVGIARSTDSYTDELQQDLTNVANQVQSAGQGIIQKANSASFANSASVISTFKGYSTQMKSVAYAWHAITTFSEAQPHLTAAYMQGAQEGILNLTPDGNHVYDEGCIGQQELMFGAHLAGYHPGKFSALGTLAQQVAELKKPVQIFGVTQPALTPQTLAFQAALWLICQQTVLVRRDEVRAYDEDAYEADPEDGYTPDFYHNTDYSRISSAFNQTVAYGLWQDAVSYQESKLQQNGDVTSDPSAFESAVFLYLDKAIIPLYTLIGKATAIDDVNLREPILNSVYNELSTLFTTTEKAFTIALTKF